MLMKFPILSLVSIPLFIAQGNIVNLMHEDAKDIPAEEETLLNEDIVTQDQVDEITMEMEA